ncbi:MAG: peptidoglycan D,D-transpeptidase FtsI family protein [Hyphomonadaceae bacterium]
MKAATIPKVARAAPTGAGVTPAAPARKRIRLVAWAVVAVFLLLAARAGQLAVAGDPLAGRDARVAAAALPERADIVDRNGELLAATLPGYDLVAEPAKVWDAPATAKRLAALFPDLDAATVERRLLQIDRDLVVLKRDLSPRQRDETFEAGLAGVSFQPHGRRVYPQGALAAHVLGAVNAKMSGVAGVESGLDAEILRAGALGKPVRLSIDVRIQHALEAELLQAVAATRAEGGAGVVLAAKTGEVLAMASAPDFDPNAPPAPDDGRRLNRAAGAVYEMGSSLKPFTVAMGLDAGVTRTGEIFDLSKPLPVDGFTVTDFHGLGRPATLAEGFAESSNIMAAEIALRVGAQRQRAALRALGLYDRAPIQAPESARALPPGRESALSTAVLGYGHGMAFSLTSLAAAYTVFANDGARVAPTLLARQSGDPVARTPVFTPASAHAVVQLMRGVVETGTGKRAEVAGLDIAGKTGSAEKPRSQGGGYEPDRLFSSFAAVFPASDPRYVIVVALDEPQRTPETENLATGGAVAAPVVARIAARIAPLAGMEAKGAAR